MITTENGDIIANGIRITASAAKHWRIYEKELETYLRELPRLLEEGEEGRYALIKGDEVLSIWDTQPDASQAGREKFGRDPIFVKEIRARDAEQFARLMPILRSLCQPSGND